MIDSDKTIVQVIIPKSAKVYIEQYCRFFGSSVSSFCCHAIITAILRNGGHLDADGK